MKSGFPKKEWFRADQMRLEMLKASSQSSAAANNRGVMKDGSGKASKIFIRAELENDIYSAFAHSPRMVDPLEQMLGGEVYQIHHKMMLKEPRVGGAWEWHQDYGYWYNDNFLFPHLASCMIAS